MSTHDADGRGDARLVGPIGTAIGRDGNAELKRDVVRMGAELIVELVRFRLNVENQREARAAAWDATHRKIAETNAELARDLSRFQHEAARWSSDTDMMRLLIDAYRSRETHSPDFVKSLGVAIEQLKIGRASCRERV